jgi:hypothetical protein
MTSRCQYGIPPTFERRPERRDIVDCDLVHPVAEEIPHAELFVLAYAWVLNGEYQHGHPRDEMPPDERSGEMWEEGPRGPGLTQKPRMLN